VVLWQAKLRNKNQKLLRMRIRDLFEETFFAITSNKARSGLTVLGIVIGVGSVVAMISIGQGSQASIKERIESIGSNLLMVYPGAQRSMGARVSSGFGSATTLTLEDAKAIESEIANIKSISPITSGRYQVTAKGANTNTSVYGTNSYYSETNNLNIDSGSFISDQNVDNLSKVAVIGPTTWEDLFGTDTEPVGQKIKINKIEFTVIGVTESKGGSGMDNQDDRIYIPISTAQKFLTGSKSVSTINVEVESDEYMTQVQEEITSLLLERHGIADSALADFSIMNQADILDTMSSVSDTLTLLLGAIAGISLLVGGIGIMNMMLTTVTERTKEIGLRKAIGAKSADITFQFLTEAVVLTFLGGIIGVIFGCLASFIITKLGSTATDITLWSVGLAFGVSALIGIIFGYYPAKRASRLNPIEALRYE
jgi:putative ABC transport system permease protein